MGARATQELSEFSLDSVGQQIKAVTVDGLAWSKSASTTLVGHRETASMIDATVSMAGYAGVSQRRRVTYSRNLNYLLVEDRATATSTTLPTQSRAS